jgi:hypothetical protein
MSILSSLKRSAQKSRLMKSAAARAQALDLDGAIDDIYSYLQADEQFRTVLTHFGADRKDIEAIVSGLMMSGHGGTHRGHFVPVSAVLFQDTLAYLLRAERGQVGKAEAYFQVEQYFRTGSLVFEPERAFHQGR